MIYQSGYERGQQRERSRDADRKHNNRSPSEDNNYRKYHSKQAKPKGKRVKQKPLPGNSGCPSLLLFGEEADVKVFRKEDEPSARGLLQQQILNMKNQIEKQIAKSYDFNWEHFKHRDALSESNSMKQQKQKEKALVEKLMSAKQSMAYFYAPSLRFQKLVQIGSGSTEREGHTQRIHDILGCYYTHVSQIPNQPQFQILNTNTSSESKLIKFDNDIVNDSPTFATVKKNNDNAKNIKGILKLPASPKQHTRSDSVRTVDPQLIFILKDAKLNPNNYSKERVEALLKPYKDSGQLEYLMKNKEVLQSMVRNTPVPVSNNTPKTTYPIPSASIPRDSTQRGVSQNSQMSSSMGNMGAYGHAFVPKADKYRTVPCKYYHSPQGCSKIENCTFIHDEKYAGQSVPMNSSNNMSGRPYAPGPSPYSSYPPINSISSMNPINSMISPNIPQNYYGQPVGYPSSNGYYPPARTANPNYMSNGYAMNQQYGQAPQTSQYAQGQPAQFGQGQSKQPNPYAQGQTGIQYAQSQSGQYNVQGQQYGQAPTQASQPQGSQSYSNPNYQYYIGNNANK